MRALLTMSFHLEIKPYFLPIPLTESIERRCHAAIRKGFQPCLKTGNSWKNQVFTIVLKEFAIKPFGAQALGEALTRKSLAISSPLIYLLKSPNATNTPLHYFPLTAVSISAAKFLIMLVAFSHYAFSSFKTNLYLK